MYYIRETDHPSSRLVLRKLATKTNEDPIEIGPLCSSVQINLSIQIYMGGIIYLPSISR